MNKPTIGIVLLQQHGEMKKLRKAWMEAEALGVDALYTGDHFFAQAPNPENTAGGQITTAADSQNFEATTVQAAMAATTTRPTIGCIVHGIGFRNYNLMADIARTIDHISGGRYVLGLGSGYLQEDYVEYGYPYPSQKERLEELARALPVIKDRFTKLNPAPVQKKIPILIASMGGPIGMRNVARHADKWNLFGPMAKMRDVCALFEKTCAEVGRDPAEIEKTAIYVPQLMTDNDPDAMYRELGIQQLIAFAQGPDWDLGTLKELLQWRRDLKV